MIVPTGRELIGLEQLGPETSPGLTQATRDKARPGPVGRIQVIRYKGYPIYCPSQLWGPLPKARPEITQATRNPGPGHPSLMPVADSESGAGESATTVTRLLDKARAALRLRAGRAGSVADPTPAQGPGPKN